MKNRHSSLILMIAFIAGLCILLYPSFANYWNTRGQAEIISNYESVLANLKQEDYSGYFLPAEEYNEQLLTITDRFSIDRSYPGYEEILDIDGNGVMGYINIERIQQQIPIYHGTGDEALARGAGHMVGSSFPIGGIGTHCALSAHRGLPSAKLFTDLDEVEIGDVFTIFVLDRLLTYQIDQIKIVLPHEMNDLNIDPERDYCTLVTCTPYGINTHRLLVRGHRVENEVVKPQIYVPNEAMKIDPLIVAPIVAIPLVVLTMIGVAVKYRKKK